MKSKFLALLSTLTLVAAGLSTNASATLMDRGNGMIYDTDQNLTWLQDANYAKTSGYDADGLMNWSAANAWATELVYGGYDDWRLPTVIDSGNPGCTWGVDCGWGFDTSGSELAYMWYDILGNVAFSSVLNASADDADVLNLQSGWYWTSTECASNPVRDAWTFSVGAGVQACWNKEDWDNDGFFQSADSYAWAVRSGDVAGRAGVQNVPEPSTLLLLAAGVAGVAVSRRRRA